MEKNEFDALVSAFEHAYDTLSAKANSMNPEELNYVPPLADAWSINEHLVHLLDADCNLFMRVRGAVGEPGKKVPLWDQESWKAKNNYAASDGLFCLDLAISLRKFLAESLRSLDTATREAAFIVHPEKGELRLAEVLAIYTGHADTHLKYLLRNHEAYSTADAKASAVADAKK